MIKFLILLKGSKILLSIYIYYDICLYLIGEKYLYIYMYVYIICIFKYFFIFLCIIFLNILFNLYL